MAQPTLSARGRREWTERELFDLRVRLHLRLRAEGPLIIAEAFGVQAEAYEEWRAVERLTDALWESGISLDRKGFRCL